MPCRSADGQRVVTASEDKTARVWDAATGKALGEPMKQQLVITTIKARGSKHMRCPPSLPRAKRWSGDTAHKPTPLK
jgi:WD40 repeat protein